MSEQFFYAVFSKYWEHEVHWPCVCLSYFDEDARLFSEALRDKGESTTLRIVNREEAMALVCQSGDGFLWNDIPGVYLFDETEEA